MSYQKGQILGNAEVRYEVLEQIDERTFNVRVSYPNIDGYAYEATLQLYHDHEEAVRVFSMSKGINDPCVVRAQLINKQENGITTILFEKFYAKDFSGWLKDLACPWIKNKSKKEVISANTEFINTFKGITRGLGLLIKSNYYHGRLLEGVRISSDNSVQLVNFAKKESDVKGIEDDIEDLKNLVEQVQDKHQIEWVALDLFHSLQSVYDMGLPLRSYALHMYTNALFCDEDGRFDLMNKLIKLRTMKPIEFDEMSLDIQPTDLKNWRMLVETRQDLYSVYHLEFKTDNTPKKLKLGDAKEEQPKYTRNGSIVLFFENCQKHMEVKGKFKDTPSSRQLHLHNLYPDAIYKLVFAFVRDIAISGKFNGIDMEEYFNTDDSSQL